MLKYIEFCRYFLLFCYDLLCLFQKCDLDVGLVYGNCDVFVGGIVF